MYFLDPDRDLGQGRVSQRYPLSISRAPHDGSSCGLKSPLSSLTVVQYGLHGVQRLSSTLSAACTTDRGRPVPGAWVPCKTIMAAVIVRFS